MTMTSRVLLLTMLLATAGVVEAKTAAEPPFKIPPGVPSDGVYPSVNELEFTADDETKFLTYAAKFKQPPSLVDDLKAIQTGSLEQCVKAFADKSKRDQVFVKGGSFLMGDFGVVQNKQHTQWTRDNDNKPLHKVTLDSYSISKYKVTFGEFDLYTEANNLPKVLTELATAASKHVRDPDAPVGVTRQQAKGYCQWIGKVSAAPFDLPTEAQWEFAARDRGKFILHATNDGLLADDDWTDVSECQSADDPRGYAAPSIRNQSLQKPDRSSRTYLGSELTSNPELHPDGRRGNLGGGRGLGEDAHDCA